MNSDQYQPVYGAGSAVLTELRRRNRVLFTVALVHLALAVLFTVLMQLDGRMLLGRNVWIKPWKFATSITIFAATMGWLLPTLSLGDRTERVVSAIIAAAMLIEITLISGQAARAVPSHFNTSTPLDAAIFAVMGVTVMINTLAVAYVLWRLVRSPPDLAPAYLWGIGLGLFVFVIASFEGGLMAAYGSHSVGVPAAGPGLPLLNWSLTGGDLRVAHFVGLHALQILPLTGYVAAGRERLSPRSSLAVVGVVAVLYSGFTVATFVQAMLGIPLVSSLPTVATVFSTSFLLVAPFWLLMIVVPTWHVTERVMASRLVALPAALLYVVLLLPQATAVGAGVLSPSLADISMLLATDLGATLAWAHFLAFDLFVGRWIYLDARQRGISPFFVSPLLALTLLFGPVGFVGYSLLKSVPPAQQAEGGMGH